MKKQTAVEWLVQELISKFDIDIEQFLVSDQAKEMEKDQIEEAFSIGEMNNDSHHYTGRKIHQDQTDYFKKTYAK
jgi:transposase